MSSLVLLKLRPICVQLISRLKISNNKFFNQNIQNRFVSKNSIYVSKTKSLKHKGSEEKDKILFYYEKPNFFKFVNVFAFVHFLFWCQMAKFTYTDLKNLKTNEAVRERLPSWVKIFDFGNEKTRKAVSAFCVILGYSSMMLAWIYTTRTVRLLVLRKDEKTVCFVTYTIAGRSMYLDVPLEKISTKVSRDSAKNQLPIKVKGKWFYYLLNTKNGTFQNPRLFDFTAGMNRTFK